MCAGLMVKKSERKRIQREGARAVRGSENAYERDLRLKRTREKTHGGNFLSYLIEDIN